MVTVKRKLNVSIASRGRIAIRPHDPNVELPRPRPSSKLPRITRLMALAIQFNEMIRTGEASDMIELARLGHVTQPRMSQIMALNQLAPDIQEALLNCRRRRASPRFTRNGYAPLQPCSPGKNSELRGSISATRLGSKTPLWKSLSIKSEKIFLPVFPAELEQFKEIPFSHDQRCQRGSVQYSNYIT